MSDDQDYVDLLLFPKDENVDQLIKAAIGIELNNMKKNFQDLINEYVEQNCDPSKKEEAKDNLNAKVNEFTGNIENILNLSDANKIISMPLESHEFSNPSKIDYSTTTLFSGSNEYSSGSKSNLYNNSNIIFKQINNTLIEL